MARGRPKSQVAPCRFCNKEFKRFEHLRRHERIHTHEKPFVCHCGRPFSRQDLLSRHERLRHAPVSVEEPNNAANQPQLNNNAPNTPMQDIEGFIPDTHSNLGGNPIYSTSAVESQNANLLPSELYAPVGTSHLDDSNYQMGLSFGLLDELDPGNTDVFSFDNVVPPQFLDSDISLCDLFQRFPRQDQLASQGDFRPTTDLVGLSLPQEVPSLTPAETPTPQNPPLPPQFPSTNDQLHNGNLDAESDTVGCPWLLSSAAYKRISEKVAQSKSILPDFKLPSKFTLIRYLEGYFCGFHDHLPFLHPVTFDPQNIDLELFLAITSCGALYRFEHAQGYQMYDAARCLVDRSFSLRRRRTMESLKVSPPASVGTRGDLFSPSKTSYAPESAESCSNHDELHSQTCLQRAQTLIILISISAWGEQPLVQDSLALGSQLAVLIREIGISRPDDTTDMTLSWTTWVRRQQRRRTLYVAYILFNLHSIAYNVPPLILNQEIALCLPSCEAEWKVRSQAGWERHQQGYHCREHLFTMTLDRLLQGDSVSDHGAISAFSNYVLIHGLIQKINLQHQTATCLLHDGFSMHPRSLKLMETALRSWQASWEATYESTLDPCSPKGPLGFNATALLRLAYIRLNANLGPCRDLISEDLASVQQIFTSTDTIYLSRSPSLDRAVLQCIHALSIPVRVGIPYLVRTQTSHWSIQHSICSFECAFLLIRWMQEIAKAVNAGGMSALRGDEQKLLAMVTSLIQETHLQETLEYEEDLSTRINRLAASTARLWAEISSATHVFNIVHRIGASLSTVANILESQLPRPCIPT
ncbi:uncharacterized protein N7484_005357 [Penicillium longicatenatum]|uniref:uncharacterized protein n=1 Tax=Penicillium longicatenatum TaxID=1561947 RepID=UPI002546B7FA|nr:uncharacterized protein N7484_005357 [Penicillium longicatenatum]KAJ5651634.1 hypothetical protein N7484_005357 [Penicillium longicatenatum]